MFCQPNGHPIDPRDDWEQWGELLKAAGVRYVRVHDGRHTTRMLPSRAFTSSPSNRSSGHTDVRTTQG